MDETVLRELDEQKILIADSIPTCVHALGAVRKSDDSLRPITDCKRPLGRSINSFMDTTCSTFSYLRLDTVAEYMTPDCFFASVDIKSAYRSVHVVPRHRQLQGFVWDVNGCTQYYTENCLHFGLKCAHFIFTQIRDFVIKCMNKRRIDGGFGYLDDFLLVDNSELECNFKLHSLIELLRSFRFCIVWKKVTPTAYSITYLGIEIDSSSMEFSLPSYKLDRLRTMVFISYIRY